LGLPGFISPEGGPRYPGGYSDYIVNHERRPGVGPLAGWRGADGEYSGRGAPNPRQLERYVANGCFWKHELPDGQRYFKHANKDYLETAVSMGLIDKPEPVVLQLYVEPLQRFRLAAQGHGTILPPETHRERIAAYFDPLPFWYTPFEEARVDCGTFPLHALTQRPMQQPLVSEPGPRASARARRGGLGLAVQPPWPHPRPDETDGWRQSGCGVDLERNRQAGRRVEPRP
jgi:hypothetical protein